MTHATKSSYIPTDSLIQYGDGIFETMLGIGGDIHHWHYHWARLKNSCERLQISLPDHDVLYTDIQSQLVSANHDFSVVKMIVSRGEGLRGYRTHPEQPCFVQFNVTPYVLNASSYQGLNVRICSTRLSAQPLLASMKHCNRLEYVMARREADDPIFDEGLLLDYDNRLIEGLISNIFIVKGRKVFTPRLDRSGVAGTMRAYLLDTLPQHGYTVGIVAMSLDDVMQSEVVFLTNATGGVMPVKSIQTIDAVFDIDAAEKIRQLTNHPSVRC